MPVINLLNVKRNNKLNSCKEIRNMKKSTLEITRLI